MFCLSSLTNAGVIRYPSPFPNLVRPAFPPRPPGPIGMIPSLSRPLIPIRGPIVSPLLRPNVVPNVPMVEKPQTTVYVGKIAPTVENDFILSLLQLCGPVKSWKRAQDPSDGTPRGFGFCEFESAEGVLRALRLLTKLSVDGQELVLNVNQATREYLERYVAKKTEDQKKPKENDIKGDEKSEESTAGGEKSEPDPSVQESKKDSGESLDKDQSNNANFGVINDEDREADKEATEKLTNMIEERLKTKPPPPPPQQIATDGNSNLDLPTKSKDGDSDADLMKNEDKNEDDTTSENKTPTEQDTPERNNSKHDRRSREKDSKDRDLKREKERELERYERERERERVRRERDREQKIREADRLYKERVKEWETREREKEYHRHHEKEREKERERERRREVMDQEDDSDDDDGRKRRRRSSALEERRRRRAREKEEDLADRFKEEEEIEEAKKRAAEEERLKQLERESLKVLSSNAANGGELTNLPEKPSTESNYIAVDQASSEVDSAAHGDQIAEGISQNGINDDAATASDISQTNNNAPTKRLGFGLVGSGKRTAVLSVFHEEEDDDGHKDKKMRPLVPIDYSTEELQAVHTTTTSGAAPPSLAAAAEFAKRIINATSKEEKVDSEKERSRRPHDRSRDRDRDRDEESNRTREESKEKNRVRTPDNKKLIDAKQLIDMIPKTKEELFSYEINWAVYDKHELHERMRPWISKKITEFLGEEETTLVDYIVSSTQEHVKASQMLELLQSILDDEAEMFVLKMWRMLIFEIKKVETGLASRSKT